MQRRRLCFQRNRLKRLTLRLHRADNSRAPIAQSLKLVDTRLSLLGREAGQESAGGLRVAVDDLIPT